MNNSNTLNVYYALILDESGSMSSITNTTISNLNEQIQTIKKEQEKNPNIRYFVSLVTFSDEIKVAYFNLPIDMVKEITTENYRPGGSTALNDAIGNTINQMNNFLMNEENYSVICTIITDGEENASRMYNVNTIKNMITEFESTKKWIFTFIGANIDVQQTSKNYNIKHAVAYRQSDAGVKRVFSNLTTSVVLYAAAVSDSGSNIDLNYNFFSESGE